MGGLLLWIWRRYRVLRILLVWIAILGLRLHLRLRWWRRGNWRMRVLRLLHRLDDLKPLSPCRPVRLRLLTLRRWRSRLTIRRWCCVGGRSRVRGCYHRGRRRWCVCGSWLR